MAPKGNPVMNGLPSSVMRLKSQSTGRGLNETHTKGNGETQSSGTDHELGDHKYALNDRDHG